MKQQKGLQSFFDPLFLKLWQVLSENSSEWTHETQKLMRLHIQFKPTTLNVAENKITETLYW
jgi:hypothetical protein